MSLTTCAKSKNPKDFEISLTIACTEMTVPYPRIEADITAETVFFFDLDGTLVDTDRANFLSYQEAARAVLGRRAYLNPLPGKRVDHRSIRTLLPHLTEDQHQRIISEKEKTYRSFLNETKLNTSLAGLIRKYGGTNTMVLVTKGKKDRTMMVLEHHGLTDKLDHILAHGGEKDNKYQKAITELGLKPEHIVVFENEKTEVKNAQLAGIKVINPKCR